MNRCVHARALEGDGEKLSRHEHEGTLLILSFSFLFMMDVGQMPGSHRSSNSETSRILDVAKG